MYSNLDDEQQRVVDDVRDGRDVSVEQGVFSTSSFTVMMPDGTLIFIWANVPLLTNSGYSLLIGIGVLFMIVSGVSMSEIGSD